jgi:AcrR family transcriptional regulator
MVSTDVAKSRRKTPEERHAEIISAAAHTALTEGLERVTLRSVAEQLGVRPGLISHYFPSADTLVAEAFRQAVSRERARILVSDGTPVERISHLVEQVQSPTGVEVARLWLNARHLARFRPSLIDPVEQQEAVDRDVLTDLVRDGVREGVFTVASPYTASVRILMAVDGYGAYVNMGGDFDDPGYRRFVADVTEWALGLAHGTLGGPVS